MILPRLLTAIQEFAQPGFYADSTLPLATQQPQIPSPRRIICTGESTLVYWDITKYCKTAPSFQGTNDNTKV